MADEKLIALLLADNEYAWSVSEALTADDTTATVCSTSDELHQLVTTSPVDVIVVNQRLPGFLTGLDILSRLAGSTRAGTVILGELNPAEKEQATSLGTSAVLAADAAPEQVVPAVKAAMTSAATASSHVAIPIAAMQLVKRIDFIKPMPQLIVRIAGLMVSPDVSVVTLAQELSSDPKMAADLLKLVNSAAIGLSGKVQRIQDAVNLIGIKRTISLVLSAHVLGQQAPAKNSLPPGVDQRLRLRRVLTAGAASTYATMTAQKSPDMAHVMAMLQDLGILVMAHELGKPYMLLFERCCNVSQLHLINYEKDQLGFTHADVSAALLQKWELPAEIVGLIGRHHQPLESGANESPEKAELLESMQFGEALADLREQTSVGRTLWFQRLVSGWGRMDAATLRVCLMQSVRRAQEIGQMFHVPAPDESEMRRLVSELAEHAEMELPPAEPASRNKRPAGAPSKLVAGRT